MPTGELERIFAALDASDARYLVVGGVAVVLHGHPRLTADLDLVIALDPANVRAAAASAEATSSGVASAYSRTSDPSVGLTERSTAPP